MKTVKVKTVNIAKVTSGITNHLLTKEKLIIDATTTMIGHIKNTKRNSIVFANPFVNYTIFSNLINLYLKATVFTKNALFNYWLRYF